MIKLELEIRHMDGLPDITCPKFFCDFCGKKIERIEQGMYHWHEKNYKPVDEAIMILHKYPCSDYVEQKEGKITPWLELRDLLGYLPNNVGPSWAKLIEEYCPDEQLQEVRKVVQTRIKSNKTA